jgi:hypothetical protein
VFICSLSRQLIRAPRRSRSTITTLMNKLAPYRSQPPAFPPSNPNLSEASPFCIRSSTHYAEPETTCIELKFPNTPGTAVYHTWLATRLGIMDNEPQFGGALLWITYSSIGSPGLVQTGWKLVEKMRQAFGENRSLETASGHFFRSDELVDLNAFVLPCFIFGWDAYLVPSHSNDFFVHISHDEYWES